MGSTVIQINGLGPHLYFTNQGPNRLVRFENGTPRDQASAQGVGLGFLGRKVLYGWGVFTADLNRDGLDDLFVNNGESNIGLPAGMAGFEAHFTAAFLQTPNAGFAMHSADIGISPFTHADSRVEERVYSGRAALKADLDADGHLDVLETGLEGIPRLHREVPNMRLETPRCTLVPVDRYVPGFGVGHAIIPPNGGAVRQWDSQGQTRSGASPFVLTPWTRGHLRFPSGAEVPYDCHEQPGPIVLHEPEWLRLTYQGRQVTIEAGAQRPVGTLSIHCDPSGDALPTQAMNADRYTAVLPEGCTRFMLRFGGRWMPRWWALDEGG
jgi:hypothetical protein